MSPNITLSKYMRPCVSNAWFTFPILDSTQSTLELLGEPLVQVEVKSPTQINSHTVLNFLLYILY